MPNDDLISRADAIAEVEQWAEHGYEVIHWTGIKAMLENQPTVDTVQVVHGRWIVPVPGDGEPYCSVCKCDALGDGYWMHPTLKRFFKTSFCPNCGAKMDGGEKPDPPEADERGEGE